MPSGCPFNPRCEYATDHCRTTLPDTVHYGDVEVACHEVARLQSSPTQEKSA